MDKDFEIVKVGEDSYELKSLVNDTVLPFKKNVKLAREFQNINADAKINMIKYMKEKGITKQDLIEEKVKNGKKYLDETNYRELEQTFILQRGLEVVADLPKLLFNMEVDELTAKLELRSQEEATRLGQELGKILKNSTPSL